MDKAWYVAAIAIDNGTRANINGRSYSRLEALVEAASLNPYFSETWAFMSHALFHDTATTVTVNERRFTRVELVLAALRCDPNSFYAWSQLGYCHEAIVVFNGRSYTPQDCFRESIRCNPSRTTNADSYQQLGM
jgi:hypothetical protein